MASVACQVCGVLMTVPDLTTRPYDSLPGNWHRQCAEVDYQCSSKAAQADEFLFASYACFRCRVSDRRAGIAIEGFA